MKEKTLIGVTLILVVVVLSLHYSPAEAANLVTPIEGRVTIELITSEAAFSNTLSVISPTASIAASGCRLEAAGGLTGLRVLSEKQSQRGCRVDLDADPSTAGIQPFPANTTFEFGMCAQTEADPDCEYTWSSDPSNNSDNFDHVQTTEVAPNVFQLAWEDLEGGGDQDFNDLIVVVRVQSDSDGDGLWDDWEQSGIDTDGDGTVDYILADADPQHKDIYLEIDYMDCAVADGDCSMGDTHSHLPINAAVTAVVNAFADALVTNPDGNNGITLHVDVDDAIPHQDSLALGCGFGTSFDAVKADPAYFGPNNPRRFTHHYAIFAHQQASTTTSSGCGELPGNDFIVTLGGWTNDVGTAQQQAGTLMHEFGHNLNLRHGGDVNTNRKPNYLSIMSYAFQTRGIGPTDPDGTGPLTARIDFSPVDLADLDENNLDETAGIGDGTDNTRYFCPDGTQGVGPGTGAIDWNCDTDGGTDTSVSVDVNGDVSIAVLTGWDDWNSLKYDFQGTGDFEDGVHETTTEIDIDHPTHLTIPEEIEIDIKPHSDPNSINCSNQRSVILVAILTTDDFDAITVDHTTVTFEGAGEAHVNKKTGDVKRHEEDVDGDGDVDLVFHFRIGDTNLNCDSTTGTLTGETVDGQAILGTDNVRGVGKRGG